MGNVALIYRKEMRSYFSLRIGWVLLIGAFLLFGFMLYAAGNRAIRVQLMGPVFCLTWFRPPDEWIGQPAILVVGFARVMVMFVIPLVAMRLFPEERQMRTMEMLLTSPVTESDLVLGKWLGAFSLCLMVIGVSVVELAFWGGTDWRMILVSYLGLAMLGGGILSMGEWISSLTKHQAAAAATCLVLCWLALGYFRTGVLGAGEAALFTALTLAGWYLSLRSLRALRNLA